MDALADPLDRVAADTGPFRVVRVDRDGEVGLAKAYGLADRGRGVAYTWPGPTDRSKGGGDGQNSGAQGGGLDELAGP